MKDGKIVLITGGSRSGKSTFAEGMLQEEKEVLYIATAVVTDREMEDRIKKHVQRRKESWTTYEGYRGLDEVLEKHPMGTVLLDCVTIMTTNIMFDRQRDFDNISPEEVDALLQEIKDEFQKLIIKSRELNRTLVMVTNEVGYGLVPEYKLSRIFRDMAGSINQFLAKHSDEVYLVACGLPLKLK